MSVSLSHKSANVVDITIYFMNSSAPGPIGIPRSIQIINNIVHTIVNTIVYGSIVAITVPIPAFSSYLARNATINAK